MEESEPASQQHNNRYRGAKEAGPVIHQLLLLLPHFGAFNYISCNVSAASSTLLFFFCTDIISTHSSSIHARLPPQHNIIYYIYIHPFFYLLRFILLSLTDSVCKYFVYKY